MEDTLQPILVILIGGLFAPILTQLLEKLYEAITGKPPADKPIIVGDKKTKRQKWLKFFGIAAIIQLLLLTMFFFLSKWTYFDANYYRTSERELIRDGLKKHKEYIIPKITIRIYAESRKGVPIEDTNCTGKKINYCTLISTSYEIVALQDFNAEKLFEEYYEALYATNVIKEPGSENEGPDKDPQKTYCKYDLMTTMKKFERKTVTTRVDYLYDSLPEKRDFFKTSYTGKNFDMFYYPNNEDDVIGEVEFQIISRSLDLTTPDQNDVIVTDANGKETPIVPKLVLGNGSCMHFNILTATIPRLKNRESFGIRWVWSK